MSSFISRILSNSTYEFFLNATTLFIVSGTTLFIITITDGENITIRIFKTLFFLLIITIFTSLAIKREVRSPAQRAFFWFLVVAWVAPVMFATSYLLIEDYVKCLENAHGVLDYLYFSYVTFTTLGYGDIQPVGVCRAVSATEAISGYLLLGVLVATFSRLTS